MSALIAELAVVERRSNLATPLELVPHLGNPE